MGQAFERILRRRKAFPAISFGLLFWMLSAFAALAQSDTSKCSLETAEGSVELRDMKVESTSAKAMQKLLTQLSQLSEKAKNPALAIGKQLSLKDNTKFSELSGHIKAMRIENLIESNYARDAQVVNKMYDYAWKMYTNPVTELAKDDLVGGAVLIMRYILPSNDLDFDGPTSEGCTIDNVLLTAERDAGTRAANDPAIPRDGPIVAKLKEKYGVAGDAQLDASKMDPDDGRLLSRMTVEMRAAYQEYQLAKDVRNILDFWRIGTLVYETQKEDILTYGADPESIGKTIDEKIATMDDAKKKLLGLYYKITEKIPSEQTRMNQMLSGAAEQILKKYPNPPE